MAFSPIARRSVFLDTFPDFSVSSRPTRRCFPIVPSRKLVRALLPAFFLAACTSGKVIDGFYVDQAQGLKVPFLRDGWRRIELDGVLLAFHDEARQGLIALFQSCEGEGRLPLRILARRLFFGLKEKQVLEQGFVSVDGSEAIHTLLQAEFEGDEVKVSSYVVKKGGCVYDLVYLAPSSTFSMGLPDFERFVQGWRVHGREP